MKEPVILDLEAIKTYCDEYSEALGIIAIQYMNTPKEGFYEPFDIVQDVWTKLCDRANSGNPVEIDNEGAVFSYLKRAIINRCLNKTSKKNPPPEDITCERIIHEIESNNDYPIDEGHVDRVKRAIKKANLTKEEQFILDYYIAGHKASDIGEILMKDGQYVSKKFYSIKRRVLKYYYNK